MKISFKPRPWPTLWTTLGLAILISLGTWQLGRYQEKLEIEARQDERAEQPPLELDTLAGHKLEELDYRTVKLTGKLDTSRSVLFKHRQYQKRPGYWLACPLVFDDGTALMVNRGWVPFDKGPQLAKELSEKPIEGTFTGIFNVLPQNIADAPARQRLATGEATLEKEITQWNSYDIEGIQKAMPHEMPARPAILVLDKSHDGDPFPLASTDTLTKPYMTSERHLGYSSFWYTTGGVLFLLWLAGSSGLVGSYRRRASDVAKQ